MYEIYIGPNISSYIPSPGTAIEKRNRAKVR